MAWEGKASKGAVRCVRACVCVCVEEGADFLWVMSSLSPARGGLQGLVARGRPPLETGSQRHLAPQQTNTTTKKNIY